MYINEFICRIEKLLTPARAHILLRKDIAYTNIHLLIENVCNDIWVSQIEPHVFPAAWSIILTSKPQRSFDGRLT